MNRPSPASPNRTTLDPRSVASALVSVALLLLSVALCVAAAFRPSPPGVQVVIASGHDGQAIEALEDRVPDRTRDQPAAVDQPLGPQRQLLAPL